jgi:hypothetical protein
MAANPYARENRSQLFADILRNARGLPEAALTMGTSLADMAGTGLGTLAGMGMQKLRGEKPDLDAATETLQEGRFTYRPRSEGGQEVLRGLETVTAPLEQGAQWVGQKTADVTGSPAAGAAVYTGLNMLDPEMLAPAAAKVAALRGASNVARSTPTAPVPRKGAIGTNQSGAWSPGDIADVEGDFTQRSTISDALAKLKPQEQKARGKQMLSVLRKYGAKEDELRWSGLTDALAGDAPVSADEIAAHVAEFGVQVEPSRRGTSGPEVEKGADEFDPNDIEQVVSDLVREDNELEYPVRYHVRNTDYGNDVIESFDSESEAERYIEQYRRDLAESEFDYYRTEVGPEQVDEWDDWTDEQKDEWAQQAADSSAEDASLEIESETDYDAEPSNYDDLYHYWRREVERRPQNYGLHGVGGGKEAKWGEYVIQSPGGAKGENYGETILQLQREGRYGRGVSMDTNNTPANLDQMTPFQRARYDALKKAKTDPLMQRAAQDYQYMTHFPETNPLVYTRESDMPKPPGFETEGSMRVVEELQSDWGQQGRKKGVLDPEAERGAEAKRLERARIEGGNTLRQALDLFGRLTPQMQLSAALRRGYAGTDDLRNALLRIAEGNDVGETISAADNLTRDVYYATDNTEIENAATALRRTAQSLIEEASDQRLPPAPFIGDAKKFSQLALQQAIADAVRRGDQYVGVSPGYTHAPERWGTEDLSWWETPVSALPGQEKPQLRTVASQSGAYDRTRGEGWQEKVRALRRGDDLGAYSGPRVDQLDLESPDAAAQVEEIVRDRLSYEARQYADPEAFIKARAAKILESMRKEPEGQYSPRAHGMNEFYDKIVPGVLEKILKEAGSSGSGRGVVRWAEAPEGMPYAMVYDSELDEWRPRELNSKDEIAQYRELAATQPDKYRFEPARMHVVEIDPELARAAKRGFKLPF